MPSLFMSSRASVRGLSPLCGVSYWNLKIYGLNVLDSQY